MANQSPEVAIAHHWMVSIRGGERVLKELSDLFPAAPIYTLVANEGNLEGFFDDRTIVTSVLQRCPNAAERYKMLLPLFPPAVRRLRVPQDCRLVLSSDASVIKAIAKPAGATHVCYCHSPPRYLWDMADVYMEHTDGLGWMKRKVFQHTVPRLRRFDEQAAKSVDHFIANSTFVARRIQECYGRPATVIHPPASLDEFRHDQPREDFYLVVAQLVSYKRVDLAVRACTATNRRLVVIGGGNELEPLRRIAGDTVSILGSQPWSSVRSHFERCRAFLMPGIEDFGISPVEAQAAGAPVIAIRAGGALDTVVEGETGLFFDEQTVDSLSDALDRFERSDGLTPAACRANAERFSPAAFRSAVLEFLDQAGLGDLCGDAAQLAVAGG